ncbi:MAG: hypothetical protein ACI8R8_003461 [Paraglaciecola sp.]|jgi:hypothetical protein
MITNLFKVLVLGCLAILAGCLESSGGDSDVSSTGTGGSTARFVIQKNHLITVENSVVNVFSLDDPYAPLHIDVLKTNLDLETISPFDGDKLLIGTEQGAVIMQHEPPGTLVEASFAAHFRSCDPVIARGDYMYVTLRDGTKCTTGATGVNQLLVFDISDITQPIKRKEIDIDQPFGLGISGDNLFVCYANGVLKFDITNPENITQIGDYSNACEDVIASNNPMIFTNDEGIRLVQDSELGLTEIAIIRAGE